MSNEHDTYDGEVPAPWDTRPRAWRATDLHRARPVDWLAHGHIPRAGTSLLVGEEGIGKSMLWVWLFAALTTGKALPEWGIPAGEPQHVAAVVTEDDWSSTVLPRLEVAGADLNYVSLICEEADGSGAPIFPRDLDIIEALDPAPSLIVVDAWVDTLPPDIDVKSPQGARRALRGWRDIAVKLNAATLLVTHTNRSSTGNARDKYGATSELRKAARATLYAQPDPDDETVMICGPEKSNLAKVGKASRFTVESVQHWDPTEFSDGTVGRLRYLGEHGMTAREIVADVHAEQVGKESDRTAEILQYVDEHPEGVSPKEVADALDLPDARRYMARLAERGRLQKTGYGKYGSTATGTSVPSKSSVPVVPVVPLRPSTGTDGTDGTPESNGTPCPTCSRRMGKAEQQQGQCFQCQRVEAAQSKVNAA